MTLQPHHDYLAEDGGLPYWVGREFPVGFLIDQPFGSGGQNFLFLHFRCPVVVQIRDHESTCAAGTCLLLSPGTPHRLSSPAAAGLKLDGLYIAPTVVGQLAALKLPADTILNPTRTDFIPLMINQIRQEEAAKSEFYEEVIGHAQALLLSLVGRYYQVAQRPVQATEEDREAIMRLQELARRIDEEASRDWTVAEMAKQLGMSPSRFSSLFTLHLGIAPRDYLINARLRLAIIYLTNTTERVAQIAYKCGFESPYYFSRIFHKRIGCPPSEYNDRFMIN
jgi:AraC-like DNA-binding protein